MNQWEVIKRAVKDIENLNNVILGDASWEIIKQMDNDLTELHGKQEREIHDMYQQATFTVVLAQDENHPGLESILGCQKCGRLLKDCECIEQGECDHEWTFTIKNLEGYIRGNQNPVTRHYCKKCGNSKPI